MRITSMTPAAAADISHWTYPPPYACYSISPTKEVLDELMSGSYFAVWEGEALIGYFCFGAAARIPFQGEDPYPAGPADIGLGLRPSLCGQGRGLDFFACGLQFAQINFPGLTGFRLSVLERNLRARRVYEKAGFTITQPILHRSGAPFLIMERPRLT